MKERRFSSSSYFIRLEGFLLTAAHKAYRFVFVPTHPIMLEVFSSSNQIGFFFQSPTGLGGFFYYATNQSIIECSNGAHV